jgi:TPR repeat protein
VSSPIHHGDDSDPVLRYAPPRAREQGRAPSEATAASAERPPADAAESSGDRAIIEMRRRLALEPEWIPEPPQAPAPPRDLWPLAVQASIALAAAAFVAWVLTALPAAMQNGRSSVTAAAPGAPIWTGSRSTVPPSGALPPVAVRSVATLTITSKPQAQVLHGTADPPALDAKEQPDPPARAAGGRLIEAEANVRSQPVAETTPPVGARPPAAREAAVTAQRTAPDFVTRQIDRDELAAMLRRAGEFIDSGDLSAARLLLRRAAESGSEEAALTLAGTFDPNVLAARGFQDAAADIALARLWYERAAQFGSSEAPRRLRLLANNSPQ